MAEPEPLRICAAVLAAGRSSRFGAYDKLAQTLGDEMLGAHIGMALAPLGCEDAWVITAASNHPCADRWRELGFDIAINAGAASGLGGSVAMAAHLAADADADGLLICLADMPMVTTAHLRNLVDNFAAGRGAGCVASTADSFRSPPAIFSARRFPQLQQLNGTAGAHQLLQDAETITARAEILRDIDTQSDLEKVRRVFGEREPS